MVDEGKNEDTENILFRGLVAVIFCFLKQPLFLAVNILVDCWLQFVYSYLMWR